MKHSLVEMTLQMKYQVINKKLSEKEMIFSTSDIRDLSQKITRYIKTSQRTLSLPVGEVMLNRIGKLYDLDLIFSCFLLNSVFF
jgi:hypothetical protein